MVYASVKAGVNVFMFFRGRNNTKRLIFTGGVCLLLFFYAPVIFAANTAPVVGSVSPASGASIPNQTVTFTTTYSDPNGWQNIQYVYFLVNTSTGGYRCFYGYYNQNTNKLYLRNDANTAWLGGVAPGTATVIENSYVKLNCSQTTVSGLTNTLTVRWSVTFKSTFIGAKNMYLYVKDDGYLANGWLQKGTWTIQLDTTPPSGSIKINNDAPYTNSATVTLTLTAADNNAGSGIDKMQFSNDNAVWTTPEAYAISKTWNLASGEGTKTVYVKFSDKAGNWSQSYSDSIILDTSPPLAPTINAVTSPTNSNAQTISGTKAQDASAILVSVPTATAGAPTYPTATTWSCALTNLQAGTNNITVKAKDAAGNESSPVSTSIFYNRAPSIGTLTPDSGKASPDQQITLSTSFIDPDGFQNLYYGLFLINTSTVGKNCFYGYYNQNTNKLYLINDAGTSWLGGYAPGSSYTIENSYVKLNCAQTTFSGSGTTLTVTWAITFKSAFAGVKNIYLYARDDSGATSGWIKKGDYCILRKNITAPN